MDNLLNYFSNTKLEYILTGDLNCDILKSPMDNHTKHFVHMWNPLTYSNHWQTNKNNTQYLFAHRRGHDKNSEKIVEHDVKSVGIADHCLIYCVTSYKSQLTAQSHRTIEMRNFKNFGADDFLLDLEQYDLSSINAFDDVDDMYEKWKHLYTEVCDKHFLFVTRRVRKCFFTLAKWRYYRWHKN